MNSLSKGRLFFFETILLLNKYLLTKKQSVIFDKKENNLWPTSASKISKNTLPTMSNFGLPNAQCVSAMKSKKEPLWRLWTKERILLM
jgi:hypothetical protein